MYDPLAASRARRAGAATRCSPRCSTATEISRARYRVATRSPLQPAPGHALLRGLRAARSSAYGARELDRSSFGRRRAEHGGLRVDTTLDPRLQRLATQRDRRLARHSPAIPRPRSSRSTRAPARSARWRSTRPGTQRLEFNLASQSRRQAGSTFKLFTLTAAMEDGIPLDSVWNGPPSLTIPDRALHERRRRRGTCTTSPTRRAGRCRCCRRPRTRSTRSSPRSSPRSARETVVDVAHRDGDPVAARAGLLDHARARGRLAAGHDRRVRDARRPRHPPRAARRCSASRPATATSLGARDQGKPRALSPDVADQVTYALDRRDPGRHRHRRRHRPPGGRQDRHRRELRGRVVLRLRAAARRPASGSATRRPRSRSRTSTASRQVVGGSIPARIWHDFMAPALARRARQAAARAAGERAEGRQARP